MKTLAELKAVNKANGVNWFSVSTMRFWNSKIHGGVRNGKYFITSEDNYERSKKLFTIRTFDDKGHISTVGKFQAYQSLNEAVDALEKLA